VADGVFFAELNELLTRELAEDGYSGVEVRVTPMRTEIIIRATRTQNVLGARARRRRRVRHVHAGVCVKPAFAPSPGLPRRRAG
jgi:small subunit ribosomal protein S3e